VIVTDNSAFDEIFAEAPLMAILRGMGAERSLAVATRAWDLGITAVEVPVQSTADVEALRVVADAARERGLIVGAGTVVTVEQVRVAKDAGAAFTVSCGQQSNAGEPLQTKALSGAPRSPGERVGIVSNASMAASRTWTHWSYRSEGPVPAIRAGCSSPA
jgi:2-keto-3-deoxy-6-phosphogluconate aldolase